MCVSSVYIFTQKKQLRLFLFVLERKSGDERKMNEVKIKIDLESLLSLLRSRESLWLLSKLRDYLILADLINFFNWRV